MTRDQAETAMVLGYRDGLDLTMPPPGPNRAASYRHGFRCGRGDTTREQGTPAGLLRARAEAAIEEDVRLSMVSY